MKQYERENTCNDYYNFSLHLCNRRFCKIYNLGNMTPKEKAEDILDKCYGVEVESVYFGVNHYLAKKFALIVVNEMLDFRNGLYINEGSLAHKYLLDIKHEIETLYENTN